MTASPIPQPTTVYSGSDRRLPPLRPYARRMIASRGLIRHLARSNLKSRHYDTALGQLWLLVGPMLLAGVYLLLRLILRPADDATEARQVAALLIMGVFVFQFVTGVVMSGGSSVLDNKPLLLNTSAPRLVYPTVSLLEQVMDLGTMLAVLLVVQLALGQPITLWFLLLPLVLALLAVFVYGLALVAATAAVHFRDSVNLLGYVMRVWLFLSPVLYSVNEIPESAQKFMVLNPLYPFFALLDPMFSGDALDLWYLPWCAVWAAAALAVGLGLFLTKERGFALRIY